MQALIVENDDTLRQILAHALEAYGYGVQAVSDPLVAVDLLLAKSFDVLLSDYGLLHMNGAQLLKKAKIISPRLTTVLMTGYPPHTLPDAEYDLFFRKPLVIPEIVEALAHRLNLPPPAAKKSSGDELETVLVPSF